MHAPFLRLEHRRRLDRAGIVEVLALNIGLTA
jgi:hypothetical protein